MGQRPPIPQMGMNTSFQQPMQMQQPMSSDCEHSFSHFGISRTIRKFGGERVEDEVYLYCTKCGYTYRVV